MASKIKLGDIFSISTEKGKGYLQLVKLPLDSSEVEKIKVFYSLHKNEEILLEDIVVDDYFYISFPVKAALKKKLIEKVGNIELPQNYKAPIYYRCENFLGEGWNIIDSEKDEYVEVGIKKLTKEQIKYSPDEVWNDTLLKEKLEEGWRLEDWK